MANLTITVNPETLKRARIKAIQEGTSVNRVLGEYLAVYVEDEASGHAHEATAAPDPVPSAGPGESAEAAGDDAAARQERVRSLEELWEMVDKQRSGSGPDGRTWTREDIYDRPVLQWDRHDRRDG